MEGATVAIWMHIAGKSCKYYLTTSVNSGFVPGSLLTVT